MAIIAPGLMRPAVSLPPGIDSQEWARAEVQWRREHGMQPGRDDILFTLGKAAAEGGAVEKAFACWEQIPADHTTWGVRSRLEMGHFALQHDYASLAERSLREALSSGQSNSIPPSELAAAYNELVFLLSVQLRLEERRPVLEEMHRLGIADVYDSKMLYFPHLLLWHPASGRTRLGRFLEKDPHSLELQIASVRYLTFDGEADKADGMLRRLWKDHPGHLGIVSALLECAYERGDNASTREILASLPLPSSDRPEPAMLTLYRGLHAIDEGQWPDGITALSAVLKQDPGDSVATMALSRIWDRMGETARRDESLDRARHLSQIRVRLPTVTESNARACRELAGDCRGLPYPEAAAAFARHAERIAGQKPRTLPRKLPIQSP